MGKNKSKHKEKTEYAQWKSIMAKLNNELSKQAQENKEINKGKIKRDINNEEQV